MSPVAVPVSCIHCGKTFYGPRMSVAMIRDRGHLVQMQQFMQSLRKHLVDDHESEAGNIMAASAEFDTMMVLSRYRSNDRELQRKVDMSRWNVHQNTLAVKITDEEIAASVDAIVPELLALAAAGDAATIQMRLAGLLTFMRDQLQEPDKYRLNAQPQPDVSLPPVTH